MSAPANREVAVSLRNVTKTFGSVVANNNISMDKYKGEILSLLGENGSGKTTLMNMLAGIYAPDGGQIFVDGEEAVIRSPQDAFDYQIGMIHQHFKLVDVFSAAENIILGMPGKMKLDKKAILKDIRETVDRYGFEIDLNKKIYEMSVSEKQTVEIIKVLYRGAQILILDEPTAVLTPQETEKLFLVLRAMKEHGRTIVIITHKLQEVLELSDRVAVLRKGEYVGVVDTKDATESSLTEMMVGKKVELNIDRTEPENVRDLVRVEHLTCLNKYGIKALDDVSFTIRGGEILGIAGIAGAGQKELLETIAGLQKAEPGSSVMYRAIDNNDEIQLLGKDVNDIKNLGISLAFVPEDRLGMGLVGNMGMVGNMLLRSYNEGRGIFTREKEPRELAEEIREKLEVSTPNVYTPVRKLSGGNVQKVLVGREISLAPRVLMTAYAVRGLDINTSYTIYNILSDEKKKGVGVVYVGEDLDVLIELCDRILVLCEGKVSGLVDARSTTKEEIGLLMTKYSGDHIAKIDLNKLMDDEQVDEEAVNEREE